MGTSPRRSVAFTEPQWAFLKAESERLGITIAELLRRIIDQHREGRGNPRWQS
jgi:hypothetical protein